MANGIDWLSFLFGAVTAIAIGAVSLFFIAFGAVKRQKQSGRAAKK
jgi:hypothetical protein